MRKPQTLPHVSHFTDRHGKVRWRFRKADFTVALGTDYGSAEFFQKYTAAMKGERLSPAQATGMVHSGSLSGSLSQVKESWYASSAFLQLGKSTQYGYRNQADNLCAEHGHKSIKGMQRRHIQAIMAAKHDRPNAANHDLRIIRFLMDHAVDLDMIPLNIARGISKYRVSNEGYHTWTEDEIQAYYRQHPQGTTAHLAMTLMLFTGAGRGDAALLGRGNIAAGRIAYRRKKMATRGGVLVDIPLHPSLSEAVADLPQDHSTFLAVAGGRPRSVNGLGNAMRAWCNEAGLTNCSAHGLRKACARRLIEAGATPHEMMAVTGHKSVAEAERYAQTFNRSAAADAAMKKQQG